MAFRLFRSEVAEHSTAEKGIWMTYSPWCVRRSQILDSHPGGLEKILSSQKGRHRTNLGASECTRQAPHIQTSSRSHWNLTKEESENEKFNGPLWIPIATSPPATRRSASLSEPVQCGMSEGTHFSIIHSK